MKQDTTTQDAGSLLDIVIHSMDQGLLVVNADLTVPILNVRATELIDLPQHWADDPPSFREILAYQVKVGAITSAYMLSSINDFILDGKALTETQNYTRKTTSGRWLDVRTTPLPQGGFVRTFTDQTERHAMEDAKKRSENAYRALYNNAAVGIYRSDVDGRQLRANPELVAMNGYHSEDDLLRAVGDIAREWYVDPSRRAKFQEIMAQEGRVTDFESEVYRHLTRERIWISETAWVIRDQEGNPVAYEGTVTEITERKKAEALIRHAAHHDALTGLPNRMKFNKDLDAALAAPSEFFLAYLDMDGFKVVNDSFGHGCGDDLLVAIAARFTRLLGADTPAYRIGGDEFAILFRGEPLPDVRRRINHLIEALATPFNLGSEQMNIGVSVGIAGSGAGECEASDILHRADIGLYQSKRKEGSAVSFAGCEAAPEGVFQHCPARAPKHRSLR